METVIPKAKEESITVDCCECGKNKRLAIVKEYYSDDTDKNLIGSMIDCGFAWIKILDRHILEIDGVNQTISYKRDPAKILKGKELTGEEKRSRLTRLEHLACQHPGLYNLTIAVTVDNIEPLEVVLKRLDIRRRKKEIGSLQDNKTNKQIDVIRLDKKIKKQTEELKQLEMSL